MPNEKVGNKFILNGQTVLDLTDLETNENNVLSGVKFIGADGQKSIGAYVAAVAPKGTFFTQDSSIIVNNIGYAYALNPNSTQLDLSNLDTSELTSLNGAFGHFNLLVSIIFGNNFNTSNVTDMMGLFVNCSSLTTLNLSSFNTTNVTNMTGVFYNCSSLTTLDLSNFNFTNVLDMNTMFMGCSSLTTLTLPEFTQADFSLVNAVDMFSGCNSLTRINYLGTKQSWEYTMITKYAKTLYNEFKEKDGTKKSE